MKNRILCCGNENILLYYATMNDKKLIYDMGQEEHEIFDCSWYEYQNEENEFYTGVKSRNNYLLIECFSRVIGSVSYAYNQAKIENMEIDIWFSSSNYTGRGLGTQTLILLTNFLNAEYKINTFLIRPSKKNHRAIRAYEKSGFGVIPTFDASIYYGEDVDECADGDYGIEDTINMIKIYTSIF